MLIPGDSYGPSYRLSWGGTPFGAMPGGLLAQFTSVRLALLIMASGLLVSLFTGYFSPLRARTKVQDLFEG